MASMTTKSLPAPCILVNFSFICELYCECVDHRTLFIKASLARLPGLESLVRPKILGWRFPHPVFDEGIHAPGRRRDILARVIFPGRIESDLPAAIVRQE